MTIDSMTNNRNTKIIKVNIIISVKDLKKKYGNFEAVKGISFDVLEGEIFGLLGP